MDISTRIYIVYESTLGWVESTRVVLGILGLLGSYPANAGVFAKNMGRIKHNKGATEYNIDAIKNTIVILVSQICRKLTQLIMIQTYPIWYIMVHPARSETKIQFSSYREKTTCRGHATDRNIMKYLTESNVLWGSFPRTHQLQRTNLHMHWHVKPSLISHPL